VNTSSINVALKIALGLSILFGLVAGWNYFQLPRAERNYFDAAYYEQADPTPLRNLLATKGLICSNARWIQDTDFSERAVRCTIGKEFVRISQFERPSAVMQAISSEAIAPKCSTAKRMNYLYSGLSIIRSTDAHLISRINKILSGITFVLKCRKA
jgi:hypothetical protein